MRTYFLHHTYRSPADGPRFTLTAANLSFLFGIISDPDPPTNVDGTASNGKTKTENFEVGCPVENERNDGHLSSKGKTKAENPAKENLRTRADGEEERRSGPEIKGWMWGNSKVKKSGGAKAWREKNRWWSDRIDRRPRHHRPD